MGRSNFARLLVLPLFLAACDRGTKTGQDAGPATTAMSGVPSAASAVVDASAPDASLAAVPPNDLSVLVISIDSMRADMPWAGYPRPIAPRLTELEKRAVSYTHAYSISSYTSASLSGFLSGKYPSELKRSGFFFSMYPKPNVMFPSLLQAKGIPTIAAHAHGYFKSAGFEQGFDTYEIVPGIVFDAQTDPNVTGPKHAALAEKLLSDPKLANGRFFAWFHFLDPHDEYMGHEKDGIPAFGKTLRDRYDAEVLFTDQQIAKLLDFVEKQPYAKRLVTIITADHGEAFGEHGMMRHGFEIWENLVHVPLFIVAPGAAPKRIDEPRSAIDLAPTIMSFLGQEPDPGFDGKSLVDEIYGKTKPEPRDVIVDLPMTSNNDKRRALISGTKKVIGFGKDELPKLFDLEADPTEKSPITKGDEYTAMVARYRAASKAIKEVEPYGCKPNVCLNNTLPKKE